MGRNEKEYHSLLALRSTLLCKKTAQERKAETQRKLNEMKFSMTPPEQKRIVVSAHEDKLRKEFAEPTLKKARNEAYDRDIGLTRARNFFLVLISLALLAFGAFLGYKLGVWSYQSTIDVTVNPDKNIGSSEAIGVYLFALTFVLAGICIPLFYYGIEEEISALTVLGVVFVIGAVVSLIISFNKFYANSEGFFIGILFFFASLFMIGYFLLALLKILLCVAVSGGLIFGGIRLLYWISRESMGVNTYKAPVIDFSSIEKTEDFQKALALDRKATQDAKIQYKQDYEKEREIFSAQQGVYRDAINKYNGIITDCDRAINSASFLNASYRNLNMVETIIYYMEFNRADTVKEAVNEYTRDKQAAQQNKKLADLEKRLREQIAENERLRKTITRLHSEHEKKLDQMERAKEERFEKLQEKLDVMRKERWEQTRSIEQQISSSADSLYWQLYRKL